MRQKQEEDSESLYMEFNVEGRSWIFEEDKTERGEGMANWVDALVRKLSGGKYKVDVLMSDPVYKSWTFYVSEDDYKVLHEKLDEKEEVFSE